MEFRSLTSHPAFVPSLALVFFAGLMLLMPMAFSVPSTSPFKNQTATPIATFTQSNAATQAAPKAQNSGVVTRIDSSGGAKVLTVRIEGEGTTRVVSVVIQRGVRIVDARGGVARFASMSDIAIGDTVVVTNKDKSRIRNGDKIEQVRIIDVAALDATPSQGI